MVLVRTATGMVPSNGVCSLNTIYRITPGKSTGSQTAFIQLG